MAVFDGWFGLQTWWNGNFGSRAKLTERDARAESERRRSGPPISPDVALRLAAVWGCVRLLSETIGTLPLGVYVKDKSGRRQAAPDHVLYALLHDSPNADQSAAEFWEVVVACLCLWGNFYAEKVSNGVGSIIALNFLFPSRMKVYRDANGVRRYRYTELNGQIADYTEDQLFHVRGFGIGLDCGLSPIGFARQTLAGALAADEAARNVFESGLQLAGFIDSGQTQLQPEQRKDLRELFERFTGSANAGRVMVLEAGMKFSPLGINPEDAQLLETRAFSVEEICRWFRVPPFMIGQTEKTTSWGTGLEQQMIGFLTFSLRPYLTRIEQAVKKQLCSPADKALGVYAEFNLEGLMRADSTGRAALYASAAQNGWMTRNEIRALENLPPVDGGDVCTAQTNLAPLDKLGALPAPEAAKTALLAWLGHNGGPSLEP